LDLAPATKKHWAGWLDKITARFGAASLAAFEDKRMRAELNVWRDSYAQSPRTADMAIQVISRVLSFGVSQGKLSVNIAAVIPLLTERGSFVTRLVLAPDR
jgi:hypothetical protein